MKAVCFCKDYPVSVFLIMTVMLLVHRLRAHLQSLTHSRHLNKTPDLPPKVSLGGCIGQAHHYIFVHGLGFSLRS